MVSLFVDSKELAMAIGISQRRVQQLENENVFIKNADGKFELPIAIESYYTNKYAKENLDLDAEKAKHEALKCKLTEIKLAHTENRMHAAEDIERVLTNMLVTFRTRILGVPSSVSPKLVNQSNIGVISSLITKELKSALTELSEYDPEMFAPEGDDFADQNEKPVKEDS